MATFKIKSFANRQGRLTLRQKDALEKGWSNYVLPSDKVLGSSLKPLVLEIGFGMGRSLLQMAERSPEKHFIGIEVYRPGIGSLIAELEAKQIQNVSIFYGDATEIVNNCILNNSVDKINIFFPDPWPKRRHHKRRLIQVPFVNLLVTKLKVGGCLHLATDWEEYAVSMMKVLSSIQTLENTAGENQFASDTNDRPLTKYEQRGQRLGHKTWDLIFKTRPQAAEFSLV